MPKNKQTQFLEDAEKLYVEDGLETAAIEGIFRGAVSRRQLDNWKKQFNWDKKRENHRSKRNNLQERVIDALDISINQFNAEPNSKNLKNIETAVKIAQRLGIDLGIKEKGEEKKKAAPQDIAAAIRKILKVK
ncbi:MAG: hypothetical protein Kow0098_03560 [Ignavibacteriaceae bacterium]